MFILFVLFFIILNEFKFCFVEEFVGEYVEEDNKCFVGFLDLWFDLIVMWIGDFGWLGNLCVMVWVC